MFYLVPVLMLLLSAYVGWHLWMLPPVGAGWRWALVAVVVLCVGMAVFSLTRWLDRLPMWLARFVYNAGNKSLIVLLYLLMLFLLADLLRLVHVLPAAWLRDSWWASGAVLVLMAVVFIYGSIHYRHKVRVPLSLDSHGKELVEGRGVRLVGLSDLHLGYHNGRKELARWVDLVNAEHPDAVLLAGDLIDRSLRPLLEEDMAAELRRIEAPVFACLGNHEYYADHYTPGEVEAFYRDAGITLLRDSVAMLGNVAVIGRDDRTNPRRRSISELMRVVESQSRKVVEITGSTTLRLHDFTTSRLQDSTTSRLQDSTTSRLHDSTTSRLQDSTTSRLHDSPTSRLHDSPTSRLPDSTTPFTIILDHQPYHLEEAEACGIDFQLSGHTHRGQVWPLSWITDALYECSWGSLRKGTTDYYVSSGLGIWGAKYRIGTQSEYVVVDIKR